jgi:hypothetical protein
LSNGNQQHYSSGLEGNNGNLIRTENKEQYDGRPGNASYAK